MDDVINFKRILLDIFPDRREDCIENIIQIVQESPEEQQYMLEEMINLLSESGESTLTGFQDQASGFGHTNAGSYYIAGNKSDSIFEHLSDMLPNADPDYLRSQANILAERSDSELENFIDHAIDANDYPTKKNYWKRQKSIVEVKIYTTNFSVEKYLSIIPEPFKYFYSPSYKYALADNNVPADEAYSIKYLLNCFRYIREKHVRKIFYGFTRNIIRASDTLARLPRYFRTPRKEIIIDEVCENIQLLQELVFVKYKKELKTGLKMMDELYRLARAEAEKYNLLETCQCCFFEGLLPEECYFCKKNCPFCKECVAKGAEHVIGKGELTFPCLTNCNSEFDISVLRMVLDKKVFEPLFTKIQINELRNANIDGLETCLFCDFSMILHDEEKIFKCQNPECLEETCRECRQKSHVPLRCNEIEYDEDVMKRTYIENKMTEAFVRTCWKCQKSFFKGSGCNKMTCPCGAKMCYVCGEAITSYEHFGETTQNKCPLYTQNLNQFHAERIRNSARIAKAELGVNNNPQILKFDPTEGLEEYFDAL